MVLSCMCCCVSLLLSWWQCWWGALSYVCLLFWFLLLGRSFSLLLVLPWPLWPWVCIFYSFVSSWTWLSCPCPGRKITLHPLVAFAPLESLLSVFTTLPFLPMLSFTWFVLLKPPSFPSQFAFSWNEPELLGFLASSFSTFPFVLSLLLAPSFFSFPVFSFFLSRQLCLSSQLFLWHLRHDPPSLLLQSSCCEVPWSLSPRPRQSLGLPISLLPSLFSVQNVAGKTLLLSSHLACLVATWPFLHLLPLPTKFKLFDSQFFKARGDCCDWWKGHKPVPPYTSPKFHYYSWTAATFLLERNLLLLWNLL